jgi:hypothetical protein
MNQNPTAVQYRQMEEEQDNHAAGLVVSLPGALRWLEAGFDGAGEEGVKDDGVAVSAECFEVSAGLGLGPERSISPNSSQYFQKEICSFSRKRRKLEFIYKILTLFVEKCIYIPIELSEKWILPDKKHVRGLSKLFHEQDEVSDDWTGSVYQLNALSPIQYDQGEIIRR